MLGGAARWSAPARGLVVTIGLLLKTTAHTNVEAQIGRWRIERHKGRITGAASAMMRAFRCGPVGAVGRKAAGWIRSRGCWHNWSI